MQTISDAFTEIEAYQQVTDTVIHSTFDRCQFIGNGINVDKHCQSVFMLCRTKTSPFFFLILF